MPKLRHIAIATNDPKSTAEFYKKAFGFEQIGETSEHPLRAGTPCCAGDLVQTPLLEPVGRRPVDGPRRTPQGAGWIDDVRRVGPSSGQRREGAPHIDRMPGPPDPRRRPSSGW